MKVVIVPTECDRKPLCKPKPEFMSLHGFETCIVKAESAFQLAKYCPLDLSPAVWHLGESVWVTLGILWYSSNNYISGFETLNLLVLGF